MSAATPREPETPPRKETAMTGMAPADAAMVEAFREAAYEIDHQRDDAPDHRAANQIIGEAFERRGLIVARREEVAGLRGSTAQAHALLDVIDGIVDDTHPEGDGCPLCGALDDLRVVLGD